MVNIEVPEGYSGKPSASEIKILNEFPSEERVKVDEAILRKGRNEKLVIFYYSPEQYPDLKDNQRLIINHIRSL